jgi:hypothetical protein
MMMGKAQTTKHKWQVLYLQALLKGKQILRLYTLTYFKYAERQLGTNTHNRL